MQRQLDMKLYELKQVKDEMVGQEMDPFLYG